MTVVLVSAIVVATRRFLTRIFAADDTDPVAAAMLRRRTDVDIEFDVNEVRRTDLLTSNSMSTSVKHDSLNAMLHSTSDDTVKTGVRTSKMTLKRVKNVKKPVISMDCDISLK